MYMQRMRDNIIKQHFKTTHPNEIWVSDVTYFKLKNKQYYICVIIDLFSRKVVGYNISLKNNTSLTKRTVREAYADRAPKDGLPALRTSCRWSIRWKRTSSINRRPPRSTWTSTAYSVRRGRPSARAEAVCLRMKRS